MTDPTNSVAEQAAPEAVRWAVNVHRVARQRQDKIQADIAAMDAKLAELSKYAAEIATNRAAASEELEKVTLDADVAMEMAMSACRTHGWTLPEPQGEPPLNQTGAFPAVPPVEEAQCAFCGESIMRGTSRTWIHPGNGSNLCSPELDGRDGACSPVATPWEELPPEQRGEPADLGQAAATPAVTTPDGAQTDG